MLCNTAIFYDIENLLGIFSGKLNTVLNLDEIYRRVLETEGVNGVSIQRAYTDWALLPTRTLQNSVLQVGIEPIQIFNTNRNDKLKNAADVSLIMDAVELISRRPEIENYVIASGDGIFALLAKKLHENGKRVIGCGFDLNSNITFRYSCDYFIALEKTDKTLVATTTPRRKTSKPEVAPIVVEAPPIIPEPPKAPAKKMPENFPKTKYSEIITNADIPIWKDTHDLAGSLHTIRKIIEAVYVDEMEGLADLEISVLKTYVVHYIPSFKVSQYGFSRFGEFIQFVLTGSPYCMYMVAESICKIARRDGEINGTVLDDFKGLVVTTEDGSRFGSIFSVPEDVAFIYTILPEPGAPARKNKHKKTETPEPKNNKPKKVEIKTKADPWPAVPAVAEEKPPQPVAPDQKSDEIAMDAGSLRKWIKNRFQTLSDANALPSSEAQLLITPEYSRKTFGIRTPILKEIESKSNLQEQRSVNGKVKYWKETFIYNGKHYLVYKDWATLNKKRFMSWSEGINLNS